MQNHLHDKVSHLIYRKTGHCYECDADGVALYKPAGESTDSRICMINPACKNCMILLQEGANHTNNPIAYILKTQKK